MNTTEHVSDAVPAPIGKWMMACRLAPQSGRKTARWSIRDSCGGELGTVEWSAGWRQYIFKPVGDLTSFSAGCLRDLAAFIRRNHSTRDANHAN